MVAYSYFDETPEDFAHAHHDFSADTLKVMLTLTAPIATNTVYANLTEISSGDGYTTGGDTTAITTSSQTSGNYTLACTDNVWTATAGTFADFRYVTLYNDTPTSPADPLIGFWDYGSTVSLGAGETFTWDQTTILTVAKP